MRRNESGFKQRLKHEGIAFSRQRAPVEYRGLPLDCGTHVDGFVDTQMILKLQQFGASAARLLGEADLMSRIPMDDGFS